MTLLYRGHVYAEAHLTHRRHKPELPDHQILFYEHGPTEEADNSQYGRYVWILNQELPEVPTKVVRLAQEFFDIPRDEAEEWVNPPDIVDSAGAWDSIDFCYEVWNLWEPVGYRTEDGAVVLDWRGADLIGPIHEDDYYEGNY